MHPPQPEGPSSAKRLPRHLLTSYFFQYANNCTYETFSRELAKIHNDVHGLKNTVLAVNDPQKKSMAANALSRIDAAYSDLDALLMILNHSSLPDSRDAAKERLLDKIKSLTIPRALSFIAVNAEDRDVRALAMSQYSHVMYSHLADRGDKG
jgi:hypothetical protein